MLAAQKAVRRKRTTANTERHNRPTTATGNPPTIVKRKEFNFYLIKNQADTRADMQRWHKATDTPSHGLARAGTNNERKELPATALFVKCAVGRSKILRLMTALQVRQVQVETRPSPTPRSVCPFYLV